VKFDQGISDGQRAEELLCPSARPEAPDALVFGVIERTAPGVDPRVAYLKDPQPASAELFNIVAPVDPGQVFRIAGTCVQSECAHFDGVDCRLAARIVRQLAIVSARVPVCRLRPKCRWFKQEGTAACVRCPSIVSELVDPPDDLRSLAQPELPKGASNAADRA